MKKLFLLFLVIPFLMGTGCTSSYDSTNYSNGSSNNKTFYGYDCTDDCSGHQAGWDWAENKGINNPTDCGGKSQSFIEGCRAYAEK